jgi:hypothetical protein
MSNGFVAVVAEASESRSVSLWHAGWPGRDRSRARLRRSLLQVKERVKMTNRIASYLIPVIAAATLGVAVEDAHSGINGPGVVLKAAFPGDAGCLARHSYGGLINNCGYAVEVVGFLPVISEGWHPTSVSLFGNNSWCMSVTTNGVGNGANIGPDIWTSAGPKTWHTLNTGDRFVWSWAALTYRCGLEPGGIIGEYFSS